MIEITKNHKATHKNGLEVRIFPDTLEPKKLIITAYYSYSNEPLNDSQDILSELEAQQIWHNFDNSNHAYLEDEAGFRYKCSSYQYDDEFNTDMDMLIAGEIDKIEYHRDENFLRPQDIEYLHDSTSCRLFEVEDFDGTAKYNCKLIEVNYNDCLIVFKDEEHEIFSITLEDSERVKAQNGWV